MEQNPLGWRVRIFTGAALAIMAAVAVRVDVLNNWQCVKSWLDRATDKGGELRGGDALKAYRRNGGPMAAAMTADELRNLLAELLGKDAIIKRASGYVVRDRSLRTSVTAVAAM